MAEAGAVIIVHGPNALLHVQAGRCGGVHAEVAAFGVTGQVQGTVEHGGKFLQVLRRLRLGGDDVLKAHVEVLFPAHQGQVRATEGQEGRAVRQKEGHGPKLGFQVLQGLCPAAADLHGPEPGAAGGGQQELSVVF